MNTTWRGKNHHLIEEAMREAGRRGMKHPVLIDIAPGAVTRTLSPFFPTILADTHLKDNRNPQELLLRYQKGIRLKLLKSLDHLLRWTGQFPLVCHEVEEILEVFQPLEPKQLAVLFADPDIAHIVTESELVLTQTADINEDSLIDLGDVVFCYNRISHALNPKRSLENLLHSVKMGGLLSIAAETDWSLNPRTNPLFIGITPNLFVKEF
jgi:hypothetical protein